MSQTSIFLESLPSNNKHPPQFPPTILPANYPVIMGLLGPFNDNRSGRQHCFGILVYQKRGAAATTNNDTEGRTAELSMLSRSWKTLVKMVLRHVPTTSGGWMLHLAAWYLTETARRMKKFFFITIGTRVWSMKQSPCNLPWFVLAQIHPVKKFKCSFKQFLCNKKFPTPQFNLLKNLLTRGIELLNVRNAMETLVACISVTDANRKCMDIVGSG